MWCSGRTASWLPRAPGSHDIGVGAGFAVVGALGAREEGIVRGRGIVARCEDGGGGREQGRSGCQPAGKSPRAPIATRRRTGRQPTRSCNSSLPGCHPFTAPFQWSGSVTPATLTYRVRRHFHQPRHGGSGHPAPRAAAASAQQCPTECRGERGVLQLVIAPGESNAEPLASGRAPVRSGLLAETRAAESSSPSSSPSQGSRAFAGGWTASRCKLNYTLGKVGITKSARPIMWAIRATRNRAADRALADSNMAPPHRSPHLPHNPTESALRGYQEVTRRCWSGQRVLESNTEQRTVSAPSESRHPQVGRETAGLNLDDAVHKLSIQDARGTAAIDRLRALEAGEAPPTRAMLAKMAKQYRRPLLTFYLSEPPREETGEETFARRLRIAP